MLDLQVDAFQKFLLARQDELLADPFLFKYFTEFADLAQMHIQGDKAKGALNFLAGEAISTLNLMEIENQNQSVLEIGGGVGLAHAWLRHQGVDAVGIEPSELGSETYQVGVKILELLKLPNDGWHPIKADEVKTLNRQFDFIFSNNVLEHIDNIEESFEAMASVLKPGGKMKHNCPNYFVPYEPHFGIPLIPGFPKLTEKLFPKLKTDELWNTIYFLTARDVRRLARKNRLDLSFDREHLLKTFQRLDVEENFRKKHWLLNILFQFLKKVGATKIFLAYPPMLSTPMMFTCKKTLSTGS